MGKRSAFERKPQDFYVTPAEAVEPLVDFLDSGTFDHIIDTFAEPCAGNGALVRHLHNAGLACTLQSDIEPRHPRVAARDALTVTRDDLPETDAIITNPPWRRPVLHALIERLSDIMPTWLLIDADWMHTQQAVPYLPRLRTIVSVGRIQWIPGSKMKGKDNCAWYEFVNPEDHPFQATAFIGRRRKTGDCQE